jgi:hypothetical protein
MRGLLTQTKNEPRLKGPFPQAMYSEILNSCQRTLDKLHSMRCVIMRQEWYVVALLTGLRYGLWLNRIVPIGILPFTGKSSDPLMNRGVKWFVYLRCFYFAKSVMS